MGAESPMLVEVEVVTKVWRESYGVTDSDALRNVDLGVGERVTGRVIDTDTGDPDAKA
jgi:hypothetical protein